MIVARVLRDAARGTAPSLSPTTALTAVATSDETSLSLAWFEYFGSRDLDRDDRGEALAQILAGQAALGILEQLVLARRTC